MSYAALAVIILISVIGGILNEIALVSDSSTRSSATTDIDSLVSSSNILTIDDASLNENPTNTQVSSPGITDRNWWNVFTDAISFDYVFLEGRLQVIRHFLWAITVGIFVWFAINIGGSLITAIRSVTRVP